VGWAMATAPEWFLRELRAFDPDLRLRWSSKREMWQLERRVTRSLHPGTIRNDGFDDDYIRAQDGYILVAQIPHNAIARSIFDKLKAADLWSNGGWEKVADQIEKYELLEQEKRDRDLNEDLKNMSKELYEVLKIRDGRSIYNAGFLQ
jgi:hypothetical protein